MVQRQLWAFDIQRRHFAERQSFFIGVNGDIYFRAPWFKGPVHSLLKNCNTRLGHWALVDCGSRHCSWGLGSKWGILPAFLLHFSEAHPLLVAPPRNSENSEFRAQWWLKNGCAREEICFLCIYFLMLLHTITLLLYSGHQCMHCTVLMCVQYNVKSCCPFLSWFAKEANVANND